MALSPLLVDALASPVVAGISNNIGNGLLALQNIGYQRSANAQNIAFQREINDTNYYRQLAENNLTREREDTAVRRAMADVTGAGLSKTLATGLSASASGLTASTSHAPSVQALRNDMTYQSSLQNLDLISRISEIMKSISDWDVGQATAKNLASQSAYTDEETKHYAQVVSSNIFRNTVLNNLTNKQIEQISQQMGITSYDFKKMFEAGLTSKGESPNFIVQKNLLDLTKSELENQTIDFNLKERKFNLLLEPLSDILKMLLFKNLTVITKTGLLPNTKSLIPKK